MEERFIEFFKQNESWYARLQGSALSLSLGNGEHLSDTLRGVAEYIQWSELRLSNALNPSHADVGEFR